MCFMQIVYYDGQFDDSRLNVSLACTAAMAGATVLNYAEVTRVIKVKCCTADLLKETANWPGRPRSSEATCEPHCAFSLIRSCMKYTNLF